MATTLGLYINHSSTDDEHDVSGTEWILFEDALDSFIFSAGSVDVADDEDIPTTEELNRAAVQLSAIADVDVDKYFLADDSANKLQEIFLAGNQNKR